MLRDGVTVRSEVSEKGGNRPL
ncbi:protein of unknown function [Cupriavidus taiwanensis]|uniref:Uncharacterized protein n=1 Tax=Cupriavidus taiwanensis TaxID=164546 RepID=A0A375DJD8_9BURK|nr:protein of unknown function [Cupriavidus taiwanensis]SOZ07876.1 hypothetical protein CBM2597_A90482 [Cupriavidus taiwanensis]SPC13386.1 hypothetical protein CT19431_60050 [Cupriavidus taiwanensis]SPC15912.1 hypothetical protein CBM2594_A70477 [Cupriavidus taiwanensis]SPD40584.1 protein of unknown function [Cupriavidus taiwanensis]